MGGDGYVSRLRELLQSLQIVFYSLGIFFHLAFEIFLYGESEFFQAGSQAVGVAVEVAELALAGLVVVYGEIRIFGLAQVRLEGFPGAGHADVEAVEGVMVYEAFP